MRVGGVGGGGWPHQTDEKQQVDDVEVTVMGGPVQARPACKALFCVSSGAAMAT